MDSFVRAVDILVPAQNTACTVLSISAVSAQSAVIGATCVTVQPSVNCYVVRGASPTALVPSAGNPGSTPLLANVQYRLSGISTDEKLAFIAGGAGTVLITPGI